jgi:glutaredoxin
MITMRIIVLKGCPYSEKAHKELKSLHRQQKIILEDTLIDSSQKEKYRTKKMPTFPQIYYKTNKNNIKIGGSSDLEEWLVKNKKRFDL